MQWHKQAAKLKMFKVGDILECSSKPNLKGVILNDHSGRYVIEYAATCDHPFKRNVKTISHQDASENYTRKGSIKLNGFYLTNELEQQIQEKTRAVSWVDYPMHKMGQQVSVNGGHDKWTVVGRNGDIYSLVLTADVNTHEAVVPLEVPAGELVGYADTFIEVGDVLSDEHYGTGSVTSTANLTAHGCVDITFGGMFRVNNYLVKQNQFKKAAYEEPLVFSQCIADGSFHAPFCPEHIGTFAATAAPVTTTASLVKKAFLQKDALEETQKHLTALLRGLSLEDLAPAFYKAATTATSGVPNTIESADVITAGIQVQHMGTQRLGIVASADFEKDNRVKVQWEDGKESIHWRQELSAT